MASCFLAAASAHTASLCPSHPASCREACLRGVSRSRPRKTGQLFLACTAAAIVRRRLRQKAGFSVAARKAAKTEASSASWIAGVSEIAARYDAFIFDLWGVIHNGSVAFPWAVETLRELKALGKPVVFLSNSSRRKETNARALSQLGITSDLYLELITSGELTWQALTGTSQDAAKSLPSDVISAQRIFTIGNGSDDVEYLEGPFQTRLASGSSEAELLLARGCSALCDAAGSAKPASWQEIEAELSIAAERGVPLLVANPDSVRPDGADSPMPGRIAQRYLELGGPPASFVGKPYPLAFDSALKRLREAGIESTARVCMVGDSAWHDVRGARRSGLDVLLLCSGVHSAALGIPQAPATPSKPSPERLDGFLGALAPEESPTYIASAVSWDGFAEGRDVGMSEEDSSTLSSPVVITCGLACMDIALQLPTFPEADAKVRAETTTWMGGGNAANTACALARLGTPSAIVSKVGGDATGSAILDGLRGQGVDTSFVQCADGLSSAFSAVLVDKTGGTRTCVNSPMTEELGASEVQALLAEPEQKQGVPACRARKLLAESVAGLHLDARHPDAAIALARAAKASAESKIRITLDAERPREGLAEMLAICDGLFCSSQFPQAYTGEAGLPRALAKILREAAPNAAFAVVTRGARGSLLLVRKETLESDGDLGVNELASAGDVPVTCCAGSFEEFLTLACDAWPLPAELDGVPVDSTGAGDVFIAGFLHAWLAGRPLAVALATGSYVATQKLATMGARLGPDFKPPSF